MKILAVDDEQVALDTIQYNLRSEADLEIVMAKSADYAIKLIKANPHGYAVVIMDLKMPGKDGAEAAREMLELNPQLIIVINSGDDTREALKKCIASGVVDFVEKDMAPTEFRLRIRQFCKKFEETAQLFSPKPKNDNSQIIQSIDMFGRSQAMADVATLIQNAAPTDCSILINGESGVGKELIARAIHKLSHRRQRPFVAINMAAIAENLAESDLFGHERGAFTGADKQKPGKFKLADGGTIFMDEIADLRMDLQVKLLRVLQEGELWPVGSTQPIKINVRVVAASHADLKKAVAAGRFREDLFYRLDVVKISVPPLRDRPEDIQSLIEYFQKLYRGESKTILMKTIRLMERYPWPGNVRELENEMEKLMTVIPSRKIEPTHLSGKFFEETSSSHAQSMDCSYDEYVAYLEELEKKYLVYNRSKSSSLREAARHRMKAPHGTIYGRMKKLGITQEESNEDV